MGSEHRSSGNLGSPLLARELKVFLRSNKSFVYLGLFLLALMFLVVQNWSAFTDFWRPERNLAEGSRFLFQSLSQGHLLLIVLLMPFLMAPTIVEEREKGTFELLLSSPISIPHLTLAKLLFPLLFVIVLLVSAFPVLALCFLAGGLSFGEVIPVYALLCMTAVQFACMGVFCSTLRSRVYEVYLISVAAVLLIGLIVPYHGTLWFFISNVKWEGVLEYNHGFQFISPFFALNQYIDTSVGLRTSRENVLGIFVVFSMVLSFIFLWGTVQSIQRISEGRTAERVEDENDPFDPYQERNYDLSFDLTSQEANPGLFLERKVQWAARLPVLVRMFYSALLISVMTLPLASYQGSWLFLSLPFIASAFFTLPLAATSISSDYERETFNLLRTTQLSTWQIVLAKFYTSLQYSLLIALALYLPGMLLQLICGYLGYEVDLVTNTSDALAILCYPILLFSALVMYTSLGLYCSAWFRQSNRSLVVSGILIFVTLVAPFLVPRLSGLIDSKSAYFAAMGLVFLSPLAGVTGLFPEGTIRFLSRSLFASYNESYIAYGFTGLQCVCYCMLTFYLLKFTVHAIEHND